MQQINFTQLVEQVQSLSLDEKQQLQCLLEKYLQEARRDEIYTAYQESQAVVDKLEFSSSIDILRKKFDI